jgi:hypothetical protein
MKTRLFACLLIGVIISVMLHEMPSLGDGSKALFEQPMPGAAAAFVFWGMLGGSASAGIFIATIVNGAMYGAIAYCVLGLLRAATGLTKR